MNLPRRQKLEIVLLSLLFLFFLPSTILAYTSIMCPGPDPMCKGHSDSAPSIPYWYCTGGTAPKCNGANYSDGNKCNGWSPALPYCLHPDIPNGYTTQTACQNSCKVTGGSCGTCKNNPDGGYYCSGALGGTPCYLPKHVGQACCLPITYPAEGGPDKIGEGVCCGAGNSCTCPTPSCTVTNAMCATANGGDTGYKAVSTGDCKGNNASCSEPDSCGNDGACQNTSTCYKPGICQDCTKTCNAGERLESTTCSPRAASCTKTNSCTGANCGTTNYSCYPIGTCQDCTPIPPSGYHLPQPGETTICTTATATCNKTTNCGVACGEQTATVYQDEKNITPNPPTNPTMRVDGYNYILSTTEFTKIRKPLPGQPDSAVTLSVTPQTPATGTYRNPQFDFNAENYGISPEWQDTWENCSGVVGEDFCTSNTTSNSVTYRGTSMTPFQVLKERASGMIRVRYHTQNVCSNERKYSTYIYPKYQVDRLPSTTLNISGNPLTEKGCSAADNYTGQSANNPLIFTFTGQDLDGNSEYKGIVLWISKKNQKENIPGYASQTPIGSYIGTDPNEIGILVTDESNVRFINNTTGTLTWGGVSGYAGMYYIKDSSGQNIAEVRVGSTILQGVTGIEKSIGVSFLDNIYGNLSGEYNIYAAILDNFQIAPKADGIWYVDQQNIENRGTWNFDFVSPTIENTVSDIDNNTRILTLSWDSSDDFSGIRNRYTIVNAYKDSDPKPITWLKGPFIPPEEIAEPGKAPQARYIGDYSPLVSGWVYPSSGISRTMDISTGQNTSGNLSFFITTYDRACNFGQASLPAINLNKWVRTKGGVFHSEGTVAYATKEIEDQFYNLGTELISSNSNSIEIVQSYAAPNLHVNPAVAKKILDINNNSGQYEKLRENFEKKKDSIKDVSIDGDKVTCEEPLGCKWKTDTIRDITYSGKIIAYSDGGENINIEEDIKLPPLASEKKSGMIVFSDGSITVTGKTETSSELKTDTIDAWLLAKNNVIIEPGTGENSEPPHYYHDQVHVTGGIVAFGESGSSPAFQLKRTLGLFNITDPVLIIDYHPKYSSISELFFGLHTPAYKREVGFKPM